MDSWTSDGVARRDADCHRTITVGFFGPILARTSGWRVSGIYRILLRPGRFSHDEWRRGHFSQGLAEALSWERSRQNVCRRRRGLRDSADVVGRRETKVVAGLKIADHAFDFSGDVRDILLCIICGRVDARRIT